MAKKKGKSKTTGTRRRRRTGLPVNMKTVGMVAAGAGLASIALSRVISQMNVDPRLAYGGLALGGALLATQMKKDKALAALGMGVAAVGAANLAMNLGTGLSGAGVAALPSGYLQGEDVLSFEPF